MLIMFSSNTRFSMSPARTRFVTQLFAKGVPLPVTVPSFEFRRESLLCLGEIGRRQIFLIQKNW